MKRLLSVLGVVFNVVLVVLIIGASVLGFSARRSRDAIPTILGRKVLSVVSGSMEPAIHTGDVIIVRPLSAGEPIRKGDVITFHDKDKPDMLITHRVIGVVMINGEPVAYTTKGDANDTPDFSAVVPEQIVGRYQWRVLYFGYVVAAMRQPVGIFLFVILPGLVLIGLEFRKLWIAVAEAEAAKSAKQAQGGEENS